jgi:HEAT repeat protein
MKVEEVEVQEKLAKIGLKVDSIYDLVNTREPYPRAIPVLIELLRRPFSDARIKEGIIRALTVSEAKGLAGKALLEEFYETCDPILAWTIGNAISVVATKDDLDEIARIVKNQANGDARQMFVITLGKIGTAHCEDLLLQLLENGDLVSHVIWSLGNLRSIRAEKLLIPFLINSNALIRKEAASAIKKIAKFKNKYTNHTT